MRSGEISVVGLRDAYARSGRADMRDGTPRERPRVAGPPAASGRSSYYQYKRGRRYRPVLPDGVTYETAVGCRAMDVEVDL